MTPEQAIVLLNNIADMVRLTRVEHDQVAQAISVINNLIQDSKKDQTIIKE